MCSLYLVQRLLGKYCMSSAYQKTITPITQQFTVQDSAADKKMRSVAKQTSHSETIIRLSPQAQVRNKFEISYPLSISPSFVFYFFCRLLFRVKTKGTMQGLLLLSSAQHEACIAKQVVLQAIVAVCSFIIFINITNALVLLLLFSPLAFWQENYISLTNYHENYFGM